MLDKWSMRLAKSGLWLFLFGLALGAAIPYFPSPRLALAAHTAAVQSGVALIAFGLLWPHGRLAPRASMLLSNALWLSTYTVVSGLTLAAVFGATRLEPIASGGRGGTPVQEAILTVLVIGGAVGLLAACAGWAILWRGRAPE